METTITGTIETNSVFNMEGVLNGDIKGNKLVHVGKTGQVKITKYLTVLGQSIYVKDYKRILDKNFEENGFCKLNISKLRNLFLDNPDCDISVLKMLEILEMKNNGKSIQEISCKVSLNEEIVKNIMKCCCL